MGLAAEGALEHFSQAAAPDDAGSSSWLALANLAATNNFQEFVHAGTTYGEVDMRYWQVLTDVRSAGVHDDSYMQEFLVHSTPEPATVVLVATGLVVVGMAARRRRRLR